MISKNRIIYIIKHNHIIKACYVFLGSLFFKILGIFISIDNNVVLFVPNTGQTYSGSPRDIYEYMLTNEKYKDFNCIWAFNNPEKMANQFELNVVKFDSFSYFITCLKAKYWIADINVERGLHFKKKGTIFLNTWHGVAMKKIGNDDSKSARYDYSNLDFLCVSGEYDKNVFSSALNAPQSSFLECGMPRNDRLFKVTEDEVIELRKRLSIPNDKKVIVYVPTWRDSHDNGKTFGLNIQADFEKWQNVLQHEYVLLFRAHSRTTNLSKIEFNDFIRDYSNYSDLNDLLIVADILITDYSSVVFDYSILEKPFICFGYDYDLYIKERGFYFDPEEVFPNGVLKSEFEVLKKIDELNFHEECKKTKIIKEKFMDLSFGDATKVCVEKVFESK